MANNDIDNHNSNHKNNGNSSGTKKNTINGFSYHRKSATPTMHFTKGS